MEEEYKKTIDFLNKNPKLSKNELNVDGLTYGKAP